MSAPTLLPVEPWRVLTCCSNSVNTWTCRTLSPGASSKLRPTPDGLMKQPATDPAACKSGSPIAHPSDEHYVPCTECQLLFCQKSTDRFFSVMWDRWACSGDGTRASAPVHVRRETNQHSLGMSQWRLPRHADARYPTRRKRSRCNAKDAFYGVRFDVSLMALEVP